MHVQSRKLAERLTPGNYGHKHLKRSLFKKVAQTMFMVYETI